MRVKDNWIFFIIYPIIGFSFVHIGNDNSFQELIKIPSYYTDILISFLLIYTVGFYIRWISRRFNGLFNWELQLKSRVFYHLVWGILVPALFITAVEITYLSQLHISLSESPIFYLELPLIIVLLILLNLTYLFLYFRQHSFKLTSTLSAQEKELEFKRDKYLIAKQGNHNIKIPNDSIAYFTLKNNLTFLVTGDNRKLLFDKSMKELEEALPKQQFYRLNRQLIAKRGSIVKCTPTETRRLKVELDPPLIQDVFIAKAKVSRFMNWFIQD